MRTASAAAAVVILWDLGPRNGIVQEEIAAFCQIEAAFFEVAVCRILRSDGLEFALHSSDNDRSDNESYNDRQQDPNLRKGRTRQSSRVVRLAVICAVYEFVTFIREGVEGIEIIFRGKIVLEAAADIIYLRIREDIYCIASGRHPIIARIHIDEKQYPVFTFAVSVSVVVEVIIGKVAYRFAAESVFGHDYDIEFLP